MAESPAAAIVEQLGGPGNIKGLTHCATRLRFELVDASGVDKAAVEKIKGVMGAVPQAGDRYQVVIGGAVQGVYNEIMAIGGVGAGGVATAVGTSADDIKAAARAGGPRGSKAWIDNLFEFLSNSFRPILGALLGASLFITFMALMATLDVIPAWNSPGVVLPVSWQYVNLMWQCVFTFLPLLVAYNASKTVGADPWVGFAIMAVMMLPGFLALGDAPEAHVETVFGSEVTLVPIFGIPLTIFNYSSQVFPPLLMAAVLGPLWKFLTKIIPANVQLVFVPFLAMLVMIPLTTFLIGPIGVYLGAWLAQLLSAINDFSPLIFAIVIPLAYPFMVPLGLHWPINAIMLLNIQTLGYDFIQGPMGAWNFACFGATAGVLVLAWRHREQEMKETATGALAAGLLGGISEPSLYGIHLRFKRIYPRMLVGCFLGGLIIGVFGGVTTNAFVFTSLLTIPAFSPIGLYAIAVAAAFFTAMFLVIAADFRTAEDRAETNAAIAAAESAGIAPGAIPESPIQQAAGASTAAAVATATATRLATGVTQLASPLDGEIIPLADVPDPVFAGGVMGPGVGIKPTSNTVVSPGPGTVVMAADTGHAVGLQLDGGIEVLIHVGVDTVNMGGEGFKVHVKAGDRVETGSPLVTFDPKAVEKAGYSLVTPMIVLNSGEFDAVDPLAFGPTQTGVPVISVEAKGAPGTNA